MTISFAKCESILKTLPIGFYANRRVNTSLDDSEKTSYYSPMEDSIVISYPIICQRLETLPETADTEEAVRSMLYHEVSHVILTSNEMRMTNIVNIFEDERIETVLRNYYHNVNFRKQIYDIHGGHAPKPENAEMAFYNAVRFGLSTPSIQKEINDILKEYAELNSASPRSEIYYYECRIEELYNKIRKQFKKNPSCFEEKTGHMGYNPSAMNGDVKNPGTGTANINVSSEISTPTEIGDIERNILVDIEIMKKNIKDCLSIKASLEEGQIAQLNDFQKTAEMIIGNFNKKNVGGCGINAYSGVLNPRAVVRPDYRYFERSINANGNNRFGSCHLNLFIDCSGSFWQNVPLTNGLLAVLSEIERKNANFSLDVVFINDEIRECKTVRDRCMTATSGNAIKPEMKELIIKKQKHNTCNYNIVLFDGDAMSEQYNLSITARKKRFKMFDMKQTTLITDPDNLKYIDHFTATKVIVTENYTDELIKHITRALTVAFS